MRLVGLTGGIASGKSTASTFFKANGIPVVDADIVARAVLKRNSKGWRKIVKEFGREVLLDNGEVDRTKLGELVFSDAVKRERLNKLLAPNISFGIQWEILKLWLQGYKIVVLDIPLLYETKMDRMTKPVIVVWVDAETQLQRLVTRDKLSEEQALNRINAQASLAMKKDLADIVIDNSGSREETERQLQQALDEISKPLTWREFALTRQAVVSAISCAAVAAMAYNYYKANMMKEEAATS